MPKVNTRAIKNIKDPVYGFIPLKSSLLFELIENPVVQRLRRIKQLGLTELVYPGAIHTRFHHTLGSVHLMNMALNNLCEKGVEISDLEYESAVIAMLLHDVGHGPFSHSLENKLIQAGHEELSLWIIQKLSTDFKGAFEVAIQIFTGTYPKTFLNQLVSGQLDVDRLDYLVRDSFFTGVSEGSIGVHRLINLMDVVDNQLVIHEKGIYSIENFLSARRLMYWQVYLHKTAVSAEKMLCNLMLRAKDLTFSGTDLNCSSSLKFFLENQLTSSELFENEIAYHHFIALDDFDIWNAIKIWQDHSDVPLSWLSKGILNRQLFQVKLYDSKVPDSKLKEIKEMIKKEFIEDVDYYFSTGMLLNSAYISTDHKINVLTDNGDVKDIIDCAELPNISSMSKIVKKHYLCWPKTISL